MGLGDIKNYNTTGVETAFRPLLDKIDFPNLDLSSVQVIPHVKLKQYLPLLKDINERFLLPRGKFEASFSPAELQELKALIKANRLTEAHTFAQRKIELIANEMHLEIDFVARRMTEILLSYTS